MPPLRLLFPVAVLVLAAACLHDASRVMGPRAPDVAARRVGVGRGKGTATTGRYIVSFSGPAPSDFVTQVTALGGRVLWMSGRAGLAAVGGLRGSAPATLARKRGIRAVDADEVIRLDLPSLAAVDENVIGGTASNDNPAGAVFYARQWNLRAVQADVAWARGFLGSPSVSIFILDTGIDYLHADLVGRVDLLRSRDLLGRFDIQFPDRSVVSFFEADTVKTYFPGRLAFTDLLFHGTHTAAIVSSNAVLAAGVTSKTNLVAVKVCAYLNLCPFSSILNGVIYAADNGAGVINLSVGTAFSKAGNGRLVGLLNQVFNYARRQGVTIVVAAGNESADLDHDGNTYEAFCSTAAVICVAATGPVAQAAVNGPWTGVDAPATYTNFGRSAIDVAAPGGNHASFVWAACSRTTLFPPLLGCQTGNFIFGLQGTSEAAPHVAGAAALLVSLSGRRSSQIKARLQRSADDLGKPGTDPFYGKGRLNVARAVGAIR